MRRQAGSEDAPSKVQADEMAAPPGKTGGGGGMKCLGSGFVSKRENRVCWWITLRVLHEEEDSKLTRVQKSHVLEPASTSPVTVSETAASFVLPHSADVSQHRPETKLLS